MDENIVIYTSLFGQYEGLIPQPRIPGIDYICLTDSDLKSNTWDIVKCEPFLDDPTRDSRYRKICPHRIFKQYEISIFMDANFLIVGDVRELIDKYLSESNMLVFDHNKTEYDKRNCLYQEYNYMMETGKKTGNYKDNPEVMTKQVERYRKEGYPEDNGLISSAVLIRRHNEPDVIRTMNLWWDEICRGSKRDQLSFNYAAWKTGLKYHVFPDNPRENKYFHMLGMHRKSYTWKLLRYRIRNFMNL